MVRAMQAHEKADSVMHVGCLAVAALCADSHEANQSRLGLQGACRCVVVAMQRYAGRPGLLEDARLAIANLSFNHEANKQKLAIAGANASTDQLLVETE